MNRITVFLFKFYKKLPVVSFDALAIPVAWYAAFWLRFNMQFFPASLITNYSLSALAILMVVQIFCYYSFKVYRGLWRFSSLNDVERIIKATVTATLITVVILYQAALLQHIPRSVPPLYAMIIVTILCSARLLTRILADKLTKDDEPDEIKRVLIIGAGRAGESLVRDLNRIKSYQLIGLIDDDLGKTGLEVHGVRVLGSSKSLINLVNEHDINLIFIAIPSARSSNMRRIVKLCEDCKVPFRTLPGLSALADGRVELNALREVNIEDLLGRDQVNLEWEKIASTLHQKRIIVTGGGGSIGSELCRQVLALSPKKLLIIENCEFNLYKIEMELRRKFPQIDLQLALASVTDEVAIENLFKEFKPDIIFHAAAYKHAPMLEAFIRSAVQNNVLGTQIVAEAAVKVAAEKFILISTDKAVNPTNIMGTTKRAAEIYCQNLNKRVETQFITVRFGNVLGSAGSVLGLFQSQLKEGGPLTVTHPDIQRYFMTIPEACQLILQAMANGKGGEIFVLDMGESIKISYLAEQLIRLAGKEPGKDIAIEYIGLRPGEKLYEELFHPSEHLEETEHEKLFKASFRELDWHDLTEVMHLLKLGCEANNHKELYVVLKNLVPEFKSQLEGIFLD